MSRRVIHFHYTMKDETGKLLTSSDGEPFVFVQGQDQSLLPTVERALLQSKAGDKRSVIVPAADAYGARDESLVVRIAIKDLPQTVVVVGDRFLGEEKPGSLVFTVIELGAKEAVLDGNHPFAGHDLHFEIEVAGIQEATGSETPASSAFPRDVRLN